MLPTQVTGTTARPTALTEQERYRGIRRVLAVEFTLNLLIAAVKGVLGIWTGSLAIASDAVHSVLDGVNNVGGFIVLRWAEAPPDDGHPYGHRKFETLAAAVIGVSIAAVALRLGWAAIDSLIYGSSRPDTSVVSYVILVMTLGINLFVAFYERAAAKRLGSEYLAADAAHTASDVLVTCLVIASVVSASAGVRWADPVGALLVTAVIGRVAWLVIARSLAPLADAVVLNADDIATVCKSVAGVSDCHRVRSRGTAQFVHVDLHVLLDGELSLRAAHDIAGDVEAELKRTYPEIVDVTIHMEPDDDGHEPL